MKEDKNGNHLIGYLVGSSVFLLIVPGIIFLLSLIPFPSLAFNVQPIRLVLIVIGICLFMIGVFFTFWANLDLFRIGKGGPTDLFNKAISPRSKILVTTGPFRYSRNPMVFGVNAIYISIAVFLNSTLSLLFSILFFIHVILYLKLTEEKRLLKDFGNEFTSYKKKTSMIIPLPQKKTKTT